MQIIDFKRESYIHKHDDPESDLPRYFKLMILQVSQLKKLGTYISDIHNILQQKPNLLYIFEKRLKTQIQKIWTTYVKYKLLTMLAMAHSFYANIQTQNNLQFIQDYIEQFGRKIDSKDFSKFIKRAKMNKDDFKKIYYMINQEKFQELQLQNVLKNVLKRLLFEDKQFDPKNMKDLIFSCDVLYTQKHILTMLKFFYKSQRRKIKMNLTDLQKQQERQLPQIKLLQEMEKQTRQKIWALQDLNDKQEQYLKLMIYRQDQLNLVQFDLHGFRTEFVTRFLTFMIHNTRNKCLKKNRQERFKGKIKRQTNNWGIKTYFIQLKFMVGKAIHINQQDRKKTQGQGKLKQQILKFIQRNELKRQCIIQIQRKNLRDKNKQILQIINQINNGQLKSQEKQNLKSQIKKQIRKNNLNQRKQEKEKLLRSILKIVQSYPKYKTSQYFLNSLNSLNSQYVIKLSQNQNDKPYVTIRVNINGFNSDWSSSSQ